MNMHLGFFVVYEKLQFISLFNKILAFTFIYFLRGKKPQDGIADSTADKHPQGSEAC